MSPIITLNAFPEVYDDYFEDRWFGPPEMPQFAAHGDKLQMICMRSGDMLAEDATWGLVPHWRAYAENPIHYAAGETITRKWSVSNSFRDRRCIIPATAFTYLRDVDGVTMSYCLTPSRSGLMLLGGIYESIQPCFTSPSPTVALITTKPCQILQCYARQMPLLLNKAQIMPWLRYTTDAALLKSYIRPYADDDLTLTITARPVENITQSLKLSSDDLQLV
ncbi:MAG: SOS response-associated peptidase family protein [Betaproteobacteria bacterium]